MTLPTSNPSSLATELVTTLRHDVEDNDMGDDDDADGDDDGAHRCDISSRKLSVCAVFFTLFFQLCIQVQFLYFSTV